MSDQRFNRQFEDVFARSVLKSFQVNFGQKKNSYLKAAFLTKYKLFSLSFHLRKH